jgi:type I restriction enzyme R subunit
MIEPPEERTKVELPFLEQLNMLGWDYLPGDTEVPYLTERESFREVVLPGWLREAVRRINVHDSGEPWLDEVRVNEAVGQLARRVALPTADDFGYHG